MGYRTEGVRATAQPPARTRVPRGQVRDIFSPRMSFFHLRVIPHVLENT
jgi:hypothetical protein